MMMPTVAVFVIVAMAAVRSTFGLKRCLHLDELCSKATEHVFDHMIVPDAKNVVSNFSRQMPISEVPSKPHKLVGIFMPDFDDGLRSGLNFQPPPIFKLQAIAICHRDGLRKVKEDIFAMIRSQENTAAVTRIKIECQSACRFFFRPISGGAMNGSIAHCHPQYRK
jgi:hypothetical protein